jgi:hypothetical protein
MRGRKVTDAKERRERLAKEDYNRRGRGVKEKKMKGS